MKFFIQRLTLVSAPSLLIFLLFVSFSSNGQGFGPAWNWANIAYCQSEDYVRDVHTDAQGNVYLTGTFNGPMTIDTITVAPNGLYDAFVIKIAADGDVLWVKNIGGSNNETGLSVTTDYLGNVLLGGVFNSNIMIVGQDTLTSNGWSNDAIFLIKMDANGSIIWTRASSGQGAQGNSLYGLSTDDAGNIYASGYFISSWIDFGPYSLINLGGYDAFLIKVSANGDIKWTKRFGKEGDEFFGHVVFDQSDHIIAGGSFSSDTLNLGSAMLYSAGGSDAFIAKFDTSGSLQWAKQSEGLGTEHLLGLAYDHINNRVITSGRYQGIAKFGTFNLQNQGDYDGYLMVYSESGNELWYESIGSTGYEAALDVSATAAGDIVLVSTYETDTIWFGTHWLASYGDFDIVLSKYDNMGNLGFLKGIGGTSVEKSAYVAAASNGMAYVLGTTESSSVQFDSLSISNPGLRTSYLAQISTVFIDIKESLPVSHSKVYPNPSVDGRFILSSENNSIQQYKLYNLNGQLIFESIDRINASTIELLVKEAGCYIIEVKYKDESVGFSKIIYAP